MNVIIVIRFGLVQQKLFTHIQYGTFKTQWTLDTVKFADFANFIVSQVYRISEIITSKVWLETVLLANFLAVFLLLRIRYEENNIL